MVEDSSKQYSNFLKYTPIDERAMTDAGIIFSQIPYQALPRDKINL